MLRIFDEHAVRHAGSLDGRWEFTTEADRRDKGIIPKTYERSIHVPSAWELLPGLENYRGKAWLRTWVPSVEGMGLRLVFGGVSHTGTVYVDGDCQSDYYYQ